MHKLQKTPIVVLLACFCCFLWGSAFPFIKIGYEQFNIASGDYSSQILFAGLRFTLSGIMVISLISIVQRKLLLPKKESWKNVIKLGLCQTTFQYIFFYIGLANTSGIKSSIISGTSVFMTLLIGCILIKSEKLTKNRIVGCLLGFIGLVLVNLQKGEEIELTISFIGEGFILLATFFGAIATVMIKKYSKKENPVALSGYQLLSGGIILSITGLVTGGSVSPCGSLSYLTLVYLAFISAAGFSIWGLLTKYNDLAKVSVDKFSIPLFGSVLSAIILKEYTQSASYLTLVALALICIGIFIVNRKEKLYCHK